MHLRQPSDHKLNHNALTNPPAVEEQHALPYLRETLVFLALAGILIPLLQRLRVNQVLGFLAVGALLGPFGLGLFAEQFPVLHNITFMELEGVAVLGEFGVLFLMFMIGLELSATRLWALRRWVFGAGSAQVIVSGLLIGTLAWWFGNPPETALLLGLVLSLSSTAVVMQLLNQRRTLNQPLGQASFSILMLQDLAVVPLFLLVAVLSGGASAGVPALAATALAKSVLAIAVIYLLGRRVIRPIFRSLIGPNQPEVFVALTLLCSLGIAALTAAAGLSPALGALLAGLLLAETEFRHEVEVTIEPFKGLLMGVFFLSVGMQTDMREVMREPVWLPLSVLGLFLIKTAVAGIVLRIGGFNWGRAIEGGMLLGQGGEFAFIVVGMALAANVLERQTAQFMLLVVALSMFATPLMARAGNMFGNWWERQAREDETAGVTQTPPDIVGGHVILVGFGRVGQLLAQILEAEQIRFVAIENNVNLVAQMHSTGAPVYFGNAGRSELLHKMGAANAQAIVLTMDDPVSALHTVEGIRRACPELPIFARARDEAHAQRLRRAGATQVVPETLESGLQLANFVLQSAGFTESTAANLVQLERERRIAGTHSGSAGTDRIAAKR